jgi:hypothetical protein
VIELGPPGRRDQQKGPGEEDRRALENEVDPAVGDRQEAGNEQAKGNRISPEAPPQGPDSADRERHGRRQEAD